MSKTITIDGKVFYVPKDNKCSPEDYDCAMQIMNGKVVKFDPFVSSAWKWDERDALQNRTIELTGFYNDDDILIVDENGLKFL